MANRIFWQYLVDQTGIPISGATINVYLAGTSTYAYIRYPSKTSSFNTTANVSITTDSSGKFYFYVADKAESSTYGYEYNQEFKVTWAKAGIDSGEIDNVQIFGEHYEVNVSDTNTLKIRSISNANAKEWQDHVDSTYSDSPHNISSVDESNTNTTKNKLVSNRLIYDAYRHWNNLSPRDDDHSQYIKTDGTRELTGNWDIGENKKIEAEYIQARDSEGLSLLDDSASLGLIIKDGGEVEIDNVNVDGGYIDGTVIGGSVPAAGTFTTITATTYNATNGSFTDIETDTLLVNSTAIISGGRIENTVIGDVVPAAGSFTYLDAADITVLNGILNSVDITDSIIKDSNIDNTVIGITTPASATFTDIIVDTMEASAAIINDVYIYGGKIDNTVIGITTPASATFTDIIVDTMEASAAIINDVYIYGGKIDNTIIGKNIPTSATFTEIDTDEIRSINGGITFKEGSSTTLKIDELSNILINGALDPVDVSGALFMKSASVAPTGSNADEFIMYSDVVSAGGGYDCPHFMMSEGNVVKLYPYHYIEDATVTVPVSAAGPKNETIRSDVYDTLLDLEEKVNFILKILRNNGLMKSTP